MIKRLINKLHFLHLETGIRPYADFCESSGIEEVQREIEASREKLAPYYKEYVQKTSVPEMAASLELAAFLFTLCKQKHFTRLLDLGSGLSSFVFRLYAREEPGVKVFSIDDDEAWLLKTRDFLAGNKLNTDNMFTLDSFLRTEYADFDCVLHDLNFVEVRIGYVEDVMKRSGKNGIVIFDDVHKPDYLFALLLKLKGSKVYDLKPATLDVYGRFSLAVVNG